MAMTPQDVEGELPRLLAFAKVVTLDRGRAVDAVRAWMARAAARPDAFGGYATPDLYRAVAVEIGEVEDAVARGARLDPLANRRLRGLTARERGEAFLAALLGMDFPETREIMDFAIEAAWRRRPETLADHLLA
jgi:hypothetical protein